MMACEGNFTPSAVIKRVNQTIYTVYISLQSFIIIYIICTVWRNRNKKIEAHFTYLHYVIYIN